MILAGGTSDRRLFFKTLRQEPWGSLGLTLAGVFFLTLNQRGVHQGRATESEPWFHHLKKRIARSSGFTKSAFPLLFLSFFKYLFIYLAVLSLSWVTWDQDPVISPDQLSLSFFFSFFKYLFIYLASLSLSWVTWNLLLQRAGSPVVVLPCRTWDLSSLIRN